MNAASLMNSGDVAIAERGHLAARHAAASRGSFMVDTSVELLRTIAEVLDIRGVFPRVSEIVKQVLRHDALELLLCDRSGHVEFEARSTEDLAGSRGCATRNDEAFHIMSDLRTPRSRLV